MINPRKKLITGIVLMLLMTGILSASMIGYNLIFDLGYIHIAMHDDAVFNKYEGVIDSVKGLEERYEDAYDHFYSLIQVKADLTAKAFYKVASEEGDACVRKHGKGCVVKIADDNMSIPAGARVGLFKFADRITGERGTLIYDTPTMNGVRKDILVYSHIKGPYYYVEITNGRDAYDHVKQYVGLETVLAGLQYAYDMTAVLACPDHENSRFFFCYPSDMIYEGMILEADMEDDQEDDALNQDDDALAQWVEQLSGAGILASSDNKTILSYITTDIEEIGCRLIVAYPETNLIIQATESSLFGNLVIVIMCLVFIVYITSIYKDMFCGVITKEKKEKYAPSRIRMHAISYGIVGILAVFLACLFIRSLSNLYLETGSMQKTLETLEWRLHLRNDEDNREDEDRKSLYIEYGQRLAELLERYPHLNEKENLKLLSSTVGAKYVMLFDANGREVSTSSDYIGMELGSEDRPTSTTDFRRILKGVPSIAHDAVRDEVTGRTLELVGVRTNDLVNGGYGVLILAMNPQDQTLTDTEEINSIEKSLSTTGKFCFSVDPEKKEVVYTGLDGLTDSYYTAMEFGLKDHMIRDGISDFIEINGKRHFCISNADNDCGLIHYICVQTDRLFGKGVGYAVTSAIGYGFVFALLCMYLFRGYTEKTIEEAEQQGTKTGEETQASGGVFSRGKALFTHKWGSMTPEEKALVTLRVILSITMLYLLIDYYKRSGSSNSAFVLDYILGGTWNRGVNLFALTATVILFCGMTLLMFFVRFVLGVIGTMMSSKGQTICRLIANMIGYLSILLFLYYALSYLGVDTRAILASVGIIGLGLTTGARDLISDILSGISLIFEGEYQMGDIVSIDGYRGMVQEIGVRTTKLEGRGGNIKTIRNSDVKNVINLTKLNSWVPVTIKVDVNYPLKDVEAIIAETLPRIRESCPEIISGPYYKGVLSVELGFAVLSVIAECREDDYHKVERALIRDVLMALRDKNVPVR